MNWRTIVAGILITVYLLSSVQSGNWTAGIHLLLIAFAIYAKGQEEGVQQGEGQEDAPSTSPLMRTFEALRADAAREQATPIEIEDYEEPADEAPMMSDADYGRIATYLAARMPFMSINNLNDPPMRRFIETKLMEGRGIGELEALLGVPAPEAQVRRLESYGSAVDPRMQAARAANQAQIDGLIAAIPKSQTLTGITREARGRHFRQHKPKAAMIMNGLRASSRVIRERMRPGRMQIQIARALKHGIHSGMPELQALRAPVTRITREGRLTSASTELRSSPPRFVR